jgi:hypothetical protein
MWQAGGGLDRERMCVLALLGYFAHCAVEELVLFHAALFHCAQCAVRFLNTSNLVIRCLGSHGGMYHCLASTFALHAGQDTMHCF